ncbi:hypothetical protein COLO4_16657 [Corchorus olitorius]|uniref:Reverse transcriptase zinc-binding domain-containing protein n=1 Tax=Corchorus olitorius TaxID=93759 RepID=A0A1R3JG58_9ROSI|nr:hypothetical protein COLO4_16657 [Corchorus olitorius]
MRVEEPLEFETRAWNVELVLDTFEEEDAWRILSFVVPQQPVPDRLIWNDSKMGCFLVRSTYYVAREILGRDDALASDRLPIWKLIWNSPVQSILFGRWFGIYCQ